MLSGFFPPGKSKHIFWLKKLLEKNVRHCSHCMSALSFYPRNGTESKDLAIQPERYFGHFGCETQLLHIIRPPFSEPQNLPTSDPFPAEGQLWGSSRRKAGVRDSPVRILGLPFPCLQLFFQWRAGVLEFSVLESFLVTLPLSPGVGPTGSPGGAGPGGEGCRLWV